MKGIAQSANSYEARELSQHCQYMGIHVPRIGYVIDWRVPVSEHIIRLQEIQ